jgi:hypothetical protein
MRSASRPIAPRPMISDGAIRSRFQWRGLLDGYLAIAALAQAGDNRRNLDPAIWGDVREAAMSIHVGSGLHAAAT